MGLLDQVIGNVLGGALGGMLGGGRGQGSGQGHGGGLPGGLGGGAMSPIVQAILMLIASRVLGGGLGGGFGDILGGGRHDPADAAPHDAPAPRRMPREESGGPFGDVFGGGRQGGGGSDFSDLAGGLDPPGGRDAGAGPHSGLDREPPDEHAGDGDGLGGLLERFRKGGYGDVLESWIGGGQNRAIAPDQLAQALGPDAVAALSQRTGLSRDDLLGQLAGALPGVIDGLTPHGRLPTREERRGW